MTPLTRLADSLAFLVQFLEHQVKSSTSPKGWDLYRLWREMGRCLTEIVLASKSVPSMLPKHS